MADIRYGFEAGQLSCIGERKPGPWGILTEKCLWINRRRPQLTRTIVFQRMELALKSARNIQKHREHPENDILLDPRFRKSPIFGD